MQSLDPIPVHDVGAAYPLETLELDPAVIIQNAIEAVRPMAQAKSIEIETFFESKIGTVLADAIRLQQVFWNLLSNVCR